MCKCESTRVFLQFFVNADDAFLPVLSFCFERGELTFSRCVKKREKNAVFLIRGSIPSLAHTIQHRTREEKISFFPQI